VRLGDLPQRAGLPSKISPASPLKIIFIGSLTHIKGAHVLLEALQKLSPEKLACLDVKIYGKTRADEEHYGDLLKAQAAKLHGVASFPGTFPHEQIGSILRNADLCVVPSIWYENAPLVLCSAIAAGTPVLVSDLGGMTEVISEGINGFQFAAGDSGQLADILGRQIDNADWLRKAADHQSGEYRTPDNYCDDIETAYFSIKNSAGEKSQ